MTWRRLPFVVALAFWAVSALAQPPDCQNNAAARYYADVYADHYNVPRELVHAIITQESGWNPSAVSNMGAMGLMQLMPNTAVRYGVRNIFSVSDNISGGVRLLADLMQQFNGDLRMVVAAYYCGNRPILRRGLAYSNRVVLSYVMSVRSLYRAEITKHAYLQASITPTGEYVQ